MQSPKPAPRALDLIWVCLCLLLGACDQPTNTPPRTRPVRVHLTCDVSGRLEPCGCFTGQFGGLSRTKTWLQNATPSLRVDAGDAIAGTEDYHLIQYRHTLKAFGDMGFHAINLGRREAGLSAQAIRRMDSPVPLISANLVDAATSTPVVKPWIHVRVDGIRYGIIGIVDPRSLNDSPPGNGLRVLDPASAISKYLPELKRDTDVLVLLAFASEPQMHALAAQFFEFQIILGGDVRQPSQDLLKANRSLIMATTNQSRALGFLEADLDPNGALVKPRQQIFLMHNKIPEDPVITDRARDYRQEVRHTTLNVDDPLHTHGDAVPGVTPKASYVGNESCATCHAKAFAIWQKTGHARAFEALIARESDADPNCIACHTIGFGTASGYTRSMQGKRMTQVGCESCHGPGSTHVQQRSRPEPPTFKFRPLSAADCTTCHHGEFSRPFVWPEFWPNVAHGK